MRGDGAAPGGGPAGRGRLVMIATGSRGDVQPQVALARGLEAAGWRVRFATHRCFAPLVETAGLELFVLPGDSQSFFSGPAGVALREKLGQRKAADWCRRYLGLFLRGFLAECTRAAEGADAVLYWPPSQVGPSLGERMGVPSIGVATYPLPHCRTRAFANPFYPPPPPALERAARRVGLGGLLNAWTWRLGEPVWRDAVRAEIDRWRTTSLGLAPLTARREREIARRTPHLLGFSPAVLPPPRDWPEHLHVTGWWFLDLAGSWSPPEELAAFLAAGPPPVGIGFGSMTSRSPAATTGTVLEALRRSGQRAVLLSGWGGLEQSALPDQVLLVRDAPHDWLFPRLSAVVHHGGSGTTAAALRAGIPSLVVPFGFDQDLWGRRLAGLGLAPEPIPHAALTPEALAAALGRLAGDDAMRRRAADFAPVVRAEDGVARAAAVVERLVERHVEQHVERRVERRPRSGEATAA